LSKIDLGRGTSLPKKTFETMNGLRGIAALIVVIWHGGSDWFGMLRPPGAYLAVDLFFVLSGFVIAHSYQGRLAMGMTVRQFFIVRMLRFYPLYILGTAISCVVLIGSLLHHWKNVETQLSPIYSLPFALAMLPRPSTHLTSNLYPLNIPAWSLFMEMIVNLTYAVSYKHWSTKTILITMSTSAVLMLSNDWFTVTDGWGAGGVTWGTFPFGLFRVFYSFPAGVLIYRIIYERQFPFPRINCLAIFLLFPILLMWNSNLPCKLSMLVGVPLLVAVAAKTEPIGILKSICAIFGRASYAIYAVHFPLISLTRVTCERLGFDSHSQIFGYVVIVSIVPICLLIDSWYDIPLRRALSRIFVRIPPLSDRSIRVPT
jgi:peptidoglycan/LPS O-acetylase OafA/YrhL